MAHDTTRARRAPTSEDPTENRRPPSLVPSGSLAGSALIVIIAIMTFLASLAVGGVDIVRAAADSWRSGVLQEVTIQVRPVEGGDLEAGIARAVELARETPGIASAQPYSEAEMAGLLEPWLGTGVTLDQLPTPRLIVVRMEEGAQPDFEALAARLTDQVPGASLDDHRAWLERLRLTGRTLTGFGLAILVLVVCATALSVLFATRGAVNANRDVVEVLHLVGARDRYVAGAFSRRFLSLGLRGGLIGGAAALVLFVLAGMFGTSGGDPGSDLLLGRLDMTVRGYIGIVGTALFIAALTAVTSRLTVMAHLRRLD
ncbi:cell division protein FtsX [Terrihabitans sp. B22-R8]|uniref:cell division protein FtsX n=1 Tax=Terrihabitans sp. B22-R8 TaxID=3425128 RepID=UPI00403CEC65